MPSGAPIGPCGVQTVFTHYGGWHSGATGDDGFLSHVCHTGDGESHHTGWGERFEHPTKTWACTTHKQFTMQMVAVAIAKATWRSQHNIFMRTKPQGFKYYHSPPAPNYQ